MVQADGTDRNAGIGWEPRDRRPLSAWMGRAARRPVGRYRFTMVRHFGAIRGVPVGALDVDRKAVAAARSKPLQASISGGEKGADSIVVSGGYKDVRTTAARSSTPARALVALLVMKQR
jgi:hypothetical protein